MRKNELLTRDQNTILVVDDEEGIRSQLKWALADDYKILLAENADQAIDIIKSDMPNLVTLDITLSSNSDRDGLWVLEQIVKMSTRMKVIMITGNEEKEFIHKAINMGAYDYYKKPIDIDELKIIIKRALYIQRIELENETLSSRMREERHFDDIIGDCQQMQEVYSIIKRVLSTDVPVLIYGESGTGKELVARAIHYQSIRAKKPFIPINCGAIPENLLESELFGHEKGAFTGAYYQKKGKFELANEGTAFLDEIGELSPTLQVKLLRFLQEKEIERVGGKQPLQVNVRIVAATNKNLESEIQKQNFRPDLYYRLSVITITLPPLRDRNDDILLLANSFLNRYTKEYDKRIFHFDSLAVERMMTYKWLGNVRELENRVKRAVIMSTNNIISCEDLGLDDKVQQKNTTLVDIVDTVQRKHIDLALNRTKGNVSKAARELGISRVTLYDLIHRFNIKVNEYRKHNYQYS
ncbi:PEP-CTERM-box response regulator transcription factor [candidate division KSB1 bacterium]|nr:PEP-CTERM-box response regulator transcription factor [candidate division KSB1 bacterium]